MDMFSLKDKVALVIGGTRGIGEGIAFGLSGAGAKLIVSSRHEPECGSVAQKIQESTGNRALGMAVDITVKKSIEELLDRVQNEFGKIDILVNSAGVNVRKDTVDLSEEEWDHVQNVQLKGTFLACQLVGKSMIENNVKGKIINISSIDYKVVSRSNIISYMAAKGAVAQMTRALAVEWAEKNITVNVIAPGYFETVMTRPLFEDEEVKRELLRNIPQKRFGEPYKDLAGLAIYFASDASDYTTGQIVCVDGGYTLI